MAPSNNSDTPAPQDASVSASDQDAAARRDTPGSPAPTPRLPFPVAGIGASAGGLEALEALIQRLGGERMAFVVVQHLAPGHVSLLADILQRSTKLRVATIEDGMHLEGGKILRRAAHHRAFARRRCAAHCAAARGPTATPLD